jgi:hypothetical protein
MGDSVHITNRYIDEATIVRMDWPARSPDFNPNERAWDMLQKAISSRHVQSTTVQELRHAIIEEWAKIPLHKVRRLISSMRRRCQAVFCLFCFDFNGIRYIVQNAIIGLKCYVKLC